MMLARNTDDAFKHGFELGNRSEMNYGGARGPFRRRGLAAAVTRALVDHATSLGARTVFLTASSPDVARLYAGLGFERIGTGYAAQRG